MSTEPRADVEAAHPVRGLDTAPETGPPDRGRPNLCGDLPTVLQVGPMFRRAVAGYDRFQVDTYVQWAEDELAAADRARDHLLALHLGTRAALEEARELLAHSSEGAEMAGMSRRIGAMLAAAADAAEGMRAEAEAERAEAEAERSAASARAEDMAARAERVLADAAAQARRMLAEAATEVARMTAEAGRIVAEAEQRATDARAAAAARLETVRATERRATGHAEQIRREAVAEAAAARLQARDEVVRMLSTGREERRRADAEAAATRERADRDAAARRAFLLAAVEDLQHQRAVLRAELNRAVRPVGTSSGPSHPHIRGHLARTRDRLRRRLAAWRPVPGPSTPVGAMDGGAADA